MWVWVCSIHTSFVGACGWVLVFLEHSIPPPLFFVPFFSFSFSFSLSFSSGGGGVATFSSRCAIFTLSGVGVTSFSSCGGGDFSLFGGGCWSCGCGEGICCWMTSPFTRAGSSWLDSILFVGVCGGCMCRWMGECGCVFAYASVHMSWCVCVCRVWVWVWVGVYV